MAEHMICSRCVMDNDGDPDVRFDQDGVCNYCRRYDSEIRPLIPKPAEARRKFAELVAEMKESGRGGKYDCVLGVSGGVDSSYMAYLAKREGLRPLLVHMDNNWDSELAVNNIENIVRKTGFDYHNHIVDWEEFKDIQLSFIKASVIDIELVTDQAIFSLMYQTADKNNIGHVLNGHNFLTESIMPPSWNFRRKNDLANLESIHARYGTVPIRTYPGFGIYKERYYSDVKKIKNVYLLNYLDYNVRDVKETLKREFGWREYGGKHYESVFTKFYQAHILPVKFNVDKRKAHYSNLILAGQMARAEALELLKRPPYDEAELREDRRYVLQKLGLSEDEFDALMKKTRVSHDDFPTDRLTSWHKAKLLFWSFCREPAATAMGAARGCAAFLARGIMAAAAPLARAVRPVLRRFKA